MTNIQFDARAFRYVLETYPTADAQGDRGPLRDLIKQALPAMKPGFTDPGVPHRYSTIGRFEMACSA